MVTDYSLGDIITLKKKHPCGEVIWRVDRIGADIGIVCRGCNRRLIIPRSDLEKRTRSHRKTE
ncbi:MAG: DUF951 domain-containing protein [SAR202 cluster bacterium]|jgi:hypothetical protein|nr:DUF951 domain-containing protein [SAR202 cluster bacterium]HJO60769.1 DUF951 domain-containing protein [SAR202 cluster bacterium]